MSVSYEKPAVPRSGLRLHFNEHSGGCSPQVLQALSALTATDVSTYPDYDELHGRVAKWFDVPSSHLVLTNGMDEGILVAAMAQLRVPATVDAPEVVIPTPGFEEYAAVTSAVGGRIVEVPFGADLAFPLPGILNVITPRTRLVYLTNPGNPSGLLIADDAVRAIAERLPHGALVFLDEAYMDFADGGQQASFLSKLGSAPNVVIGRTFSKAHGLAGLRLGAMLALPETLEPLRLIVPPFSVNVFAVTGVMAALDDRAYVEQYQREVSASRELVYDACARLGLHCWHSQANFVLVRVGDAARAVFDHLRARGIHVRLLSKPSGLEGCIRITTGVVAHTKTCLAAMEDALCARPR